MTECIEREAFLKWAREFYPNDKVFASAIINAPTADVAPVVHGRWLCDGDFVICPRCEAEMDQKNSLGVDNFKNYCPNCGAKMDGGGEDAVD